jgi:predicted regulator of Ras-like GTPase activity (Roadblock/LC7/MglB family)
MATPFTPMLQTLARQRGVSAALVTIENDGIVVDSHSHVGLSEERVAALAASLYRKARLSSNAAGMGAVSFMQLEAPNGRMFIVGAGALVLVVVAAPTLNVGRVRVEMLRAIPELEAIGIMGLA